MAKKDLDVIKGHTKGFFGEFKEFISRGNVMDLAVGVIIGGAFQKIVTSLVNDLIMPWVGLLTGDVNFTDQFLILKLPEGVEKAQVTSVVVAQELGVTTFNYGAFITAVIDFLIMAFVIFLLVRVLNRISGKAKQEEEAKKAAEEAKAKADAEAAAKAEEEAKKLSKEAELLLEIRDLMKKNG